MSIAYGAAKYAKVLTGDIGEELKNILVLDKMHNAMKVIVNDNETVLEYKIVDISKDLIGEEVPHQMFEATIPTKKFLRYRSETE